uniref:ATP-binding cassette sub-family C member 12 isoform X2 n=1 Tax=Myxine glutinosa TaxID=7769 RepID=UPI00358FE290
MKVSKDDHVVELVGISSRLGQREPSGEEIVTRALSLDAPLDLGIPRKSRKYAESRKMLLPFRIKSKHSEAHPIDQAGLISSALFSWETPIMLKGYKRKLDVNNVPPLSNYDATALNNSRLERLWQEELKKKGEEKASLFHVVLRFQKTRLLISGIPMALYVIMSFTSATVILQSILQYTERESKKVSLGVGLCFALLLSEALRSTMFALVWAINNRTGIRLRSAATNMAFRKIMRLHGLGNTSVGQVINVLSNDGQRLFEAATFGPLLLIVPFLLLLGAAYTILLLRTSALVGIAIFLLYWPIQLIMVRMTGRFRRNAIVHTDNRVCIMNEVLTYIKLIKMYAWEQSFANEINEIRALENRILQKAAYMQSFNASMANTVPNIAVIFSFIVYTLLGHNLVSSNAFTVTAVFNVMRVTIGMLPFTIRAVAESRISIARIQRLMMMKEPQSYLTMQKDSQFAVTMQNAALYWSSNNILPSVSTTAKQDGFQGTSTCPSMLHKDKATLQNMNLYLKRGELLGVCGNVGSGKSSLIASLLGQMELGSGKVSVNGSIAYVPQQAWILHMTVRENILFGEEYEEQRYNEVIEVCGLKSDLEILMHGDETEIGERGLNLSGGQKQRVSLARAIYSNRDIYLLDDPLSALDSHVGSHVFQHCILSALRHKTVLLVTHQLQYLKFCDDIAVLENGQIVENGRHEDLINVKGKYAGLIKNFQMDANEDPESQMSERSLDKDIPKYNSLQLNEVTTEKKPEFGVERIEESDQAQNKTNSTTNFFQRNNSTKGILNPAWKNEEGKTMFEHEGLKDPPNAKEEDDQRKGNSSMAKVKLVKDEEKGSNLMQWKTCHHYIKAGGGYFMLLLVFLTYFFSTGCIIFSSWWLTAWLANGDGKNCTLPANEMCKLGNITENPNIHMFQAVYAAAAIGMLLFSSIKAFVYGWATLRASSHLHDTVFYKVLRSPMMFFDSEPVGRIVNRFSKDLDEVDVQLPFNADNFLIQLFLMLFTLATLAIIFPPFLALVFVLVIIFLIITRLFRVAIRELKQLENITRSPLFSHVTTSIQGLGVIHAYNKADEFVERHQLLTDINGSMYLLFQSGMRWLAIRLDLLSTIITFVVALFVVLNNGLIDSSQSGLALSYAMRLTGMLQFCVRMGTETEARFTSVERITDYIERCEEEDEGKTETVALPQSWPSEGKITFLNYSMRYRKETPLVLKCLNLTIEPKEKVGIVGRTGAGKTSLGTALFRLVDACEGAIVIDKIETNNVELRELRSRISVIPQDPVLFVGTIRYNLDPFNKYMDDQIWQALERTYMKETIVNLPEKLQTKVLENGENMSVGERQLLCMTRALLRNTKIILLDEATAAIDTETDSLIQETIRQSFNNCTMLTIAHRLNTVLNCDRIMVMENGQVVEFDTPSALLSRPNSLFSALNAAARTQEMCHIFTPIFMKHHYLVEVVTSWKPIVFEDKRDVLRPGNFKSQRSQQGVTRVNTSICAGGFFWKQTASVR